MRRMLKDKSNPWIIATFFLLAVSVISSGVSFYLYQRANAFETLYQHALDDLGRIGMKVDILFKFENGTKRWYNDTYVASGWTLLNLTISSANGHVEYSMMYGSAFVTAIFGVAGSGNEAWMWWKFNQGSGSWELGPVGAGQYVMRDGDIVAWYFEDISSFPPLPP